MSYADAAASSGPIGIEEPIAAPAEIRNTPSEAVPIVSEKEFKREAKNLKNKVAKETKEIDSKVREEVENFQRETASVFGSLKNYVASFWQTVSEKEHELAEDIKETANSPANKRRLSRIQTELQNPVVFTQLVVAVLGAAASAALYHERGRILSNHKAVVGYHYAIISGVLALDALLFNAFYLKYDKKRGL